MAEDLCYDDGSALQALHDQVYGGPGVGVVESAAQGLGVLEPWVTSSSGRIQQSLRGAGVDWHGQAADATELLDAVRELQPDLAVVDIRMPPTHGTEGLDAAKTIRQEWPEIAILVLSVACASTMVFLVPRLSVLATEELIEKAEEEETGLL